MLKSLLVFAVALSGCSLIPGGDAAAPLAKPVLDAAHAMCVERNRSALDDAADAYCEHEANLRPFVELILTRSKACK